MKIVHVCAGWQPNNGAAVIARLIAGEQKERGDQVSLRTWAGMGMLRAADEVWIHCGWMPCLWWAALWARRAVWVPEACYDPVRLAYHGWKKRLAGPVERLALRRCSRIVATCRAEKAWIESYLGAGCPTVEVTDIKRFFKLETGTKCQTPCASSRPLRILYLGRRHPLKGVEFLERAVREINDEAGRAKDERRSVELRIVSDHFGEELERDWAWCDALVLPTLSDNLGLVVAEALERGKRVVVTDGAPAWGEGELFDCSGCSIGYGGRLVYLKGYRAGTDATRVKLLKEAMTRGVGVGR